MLKALWSGIFSVLQVLAFALGLFFFLYLLVMRPHKIKGESMMPNFPNAEYLLTERVSYYFHDPKRGDVVVFLPPVSEDEYIKRVIGLPGDTVAIRNNQVYLNNQLLTEDYLPKETVTADGNFIKEGESYTIPADKFIVLGDNRSHSYDSRSWGPIKKSDIRGRAWIIYWPVSKFKVLN